MSVINQMLKDLDDRKAPAGQQSDFSRGEIQQKKSPHAAVTWLLLMLFLSLVAGGGFYIWQLSTENSALKATTEQLKLEQLKAEQQKLTQVPATIAQQSVIETNSKVTATPAALVHKENNAKITAKQIAQKEQQLATRFQAQQPQVMTTKDHSHPHPNNPHKVDHQHGETAAKPVAKPKTVPAKPAENKPSSFTIARKTMTSEQMVAHKLSAAEQALADNKVSKAEQLFEDVLLLDKNHKSARQQLAALWFGKESYQAAINLLAQGVAITPGDEDFRMMKARIHLKLTDYQAAYQTLVAGSDEVSIEYLSLLGNLAQQLEYYQQAASTYQKLTQRQPRAGRWWLGLAIANDSLGLFKEAVVAYQQVVLQQDLSQTTINFAQERIEALGE